ncbi:MAG: signal recognition particle-docking protein FtsY [Melioribacteraceae bacterium]|nr:signal recognition particle-docking protein FtsY [Melioribacteraceae bacterium]MCF8352901.1 signal recognition particle-docking protein FtsY [Melioribacteraceae bacterium]MCF8393782.1 signal recognition particle-docking protein FtsY [Melioribacteraceae bacterium]MCF8417418.1 signal recognition particle-docking protein FtsY [Melioribacteraceae bacterium]
MKLFKNLNFDKLKSGLNKTREKLVDRISETVSGKAKIDDATLDDLEEILITSDIGLDTAEDIIERTRKSLRNEPERNSETVLRIIKQELINVLKEHSFETEYEKLEKYQPFVILIVGVNGAGKTTTIGKLAHNYKRAGLKVVIGSADTFRAAANEQLEVWANRAGVELIQRESGADPSSVAFDTLSSAKETNADIVLIDTAGRLHTKHNLMEELKKIKRVMSKVLDYAPNEIFLVLDGNTGQNALLQAKEFTKYTEISGLIITKLDGTAKGGVIFQACSEQNVPVRYIGVGEGIEDLQSFEPDKFVDALFTK